MKTITLQFADSDDLKAFEKYLGMAKAQEGTVTGLYCGLMCSALRRSEVVTDTKPELLQACKDAMRVIETAKRYFPKSIRNRDKFDLLNIENNSIAKAIRKAEGNA